jgi:hypothetical protein
LGSSKISLSFNSGYLPPASDVSASHTDGTGNLPVAAQVVLDQIKRLASPPTNARSFLVTDSYGRGKKEPAGEAYKKKIFNGLANLHYGLPFLQIGYAGKLFQTSPLRLK